MSKALSNWASFAEIVSGVAVIITLGLLIIGIRENTETTRAAMFASSIESINALERSIMLDADVSEIYAAYVDGHTSELKSAERNRLRLLIANYFRSYDIAYSMRKYGLFGENEWNRFERAICTSYKVASDAGYSELISRLTTQEFMDYVRSSCAN